MPHLVNSGSDVVVPCFGLFGHSTYHVLIFIFGVVYRETVLWHPCWLCWGAGCKNRSSCRRNRHISEVLQNVRISKHRRCVVCIAEEISNTYFDPCINYFFTCIIKTIFHLRSLFFIVILSTLFKKAFLTLHWLLW